ncbi:MAG: TetR/AcrR family transcriptional regulator [Clostridia bacterium]|nr:TetR/AcrR family transcriptional regulator [Clostridia bacterium]
MGAKGLATDTRILNAAEKLFAKSGFSAVTMKDICTAAEISRGGLYRHFSSTSVIFTEIIKREQEMALSSLKKAKDGEVSADKILNVYLSHRMNRILEEDFGIDNAITEFASNSKEGKEIAAKRASDCLKIIEELIKTGNKTGVYNCKDIKATAKQICFIIEGMYKHSAIIPVTEKDVKDQLKLINKMLK